MGIPIIRVQRTYLVNNILIVLKFRHKLMLQFFVHVSVGWVVSKLVCEL